MKNIKKFNQFTNEEINLKKTLTGIALGATLLGAPSCQNNELYDKTDKFVQSLATETQSYGMFGDKIETTSDGEYQIKPSGRLINVKIKKEASQEEYEELRSELESRYKNDPRVNKVYICGFGTIMIDCRN